MASGSKKDDYLPEQYRRQLEHSRSWKARNRVRVREYNRVYQERRRERGREASSDTPE